MATRRQDRAGIFRGASRMPRKRPAPTGPQAALTALKGVAYTWDLASDALAWGPNAAEVLDMPSNALPQTGSAYARLVEPGSGSDRRSALAAEGGPVLAYDGRYALRFAPNRVLMVQDSGRWQTDARGRPTLLRGLLRVDAGASAQDLLPAAIVARSVLLRLIQDRIEEAAQLSHTCTLMVGAFEPDQDVSMQAAARSLRPMLRRGDHVAMLSPGRFALILACCPAAEAPSAMKRALALVTADGISPTLRLGAACSPDHTFEATKLLRFAEEAAEAAKTRPEPFVLHRTRHAGKPKSREAPSDLVDALNDRRLILACQPVVDAQLRQPALVRASAAIREPDGRTGAVGPLPALEAANLALLVDARLLELAADHLARCPETRLVLPVSPATLLDREWLPMLAAHLGARPGIAARLVVAVPEEVLSDPGAVLGPLNAMKALGLGIGLTGFGTGHASLAALKSVPVDLAVIDGIFVQPLKRSTGDRLFVRTLIDMAHHLGIATAAEWVDDEASARLLSAWGVDYLQGSPFGEAEPVAEPESLLRRLRRA